MSVPSVSIEVEKKSEIKPYQTMQGHTSEVFGVVHLPDGRHIITCSDDASLRLWDRESGIQIGSNWEDGGDQTGVVTIALSPNGKTVASGNSGGMVKLWDIETRKVTAKWSGHTQFVRSVCWSADGMHVASGSFDGTVRVWEMESGETVLGPIKTGNRSVHAMAYSPDSSNIAVGSDNAIQIWDTRTGERLSMLEHDSEVWSLALDQKKLVAGFRNGSIRIFNNTTREQIAILEGHTRYVNAILLFQNGRLLASVSDDDTARLWNLDMNLPVGPPIYHQHTVWDAALSADEKFLVTACIDSNAYVWDIHTILKDSGLEELLSVPNNVTGVKSILDSDATRRPKNTAVARSIPQAFFDDARDDSDINSSTTPANPPTANSDPPPSTTQADHPPSTHRHRRILASFSVSGARALLARVLPRLPQRSTNLPMDLQRHSSQPLVSVHGPVHAEVPAVMDNQSNARPRLAQDGDSQRPLQSLSVDVQDRIHSSTTRTHPPSSEFRRRHAVAPSSSSSAHPLLGRISERLHGSQPNANESTEIQEYTAQRVISHHEPAIVEVPEGRDKQALYVAPPPKPPSGKKYLKHDTWWARCILFFCCVPISKKDGNEGGNSIPVADVERPAKNLAEPTPMQTK